MEHRRLRLLFLIVAVFAFLVIVWYFFFAAPKEAPTLTDTANPLPVTSLPARFAFIFSSNTKNNAPATSTETEVTDPTQEPFIEVWDKPTTGNMFTARSYLKQVSATSTSGTTTTTVTKTVRATSTTLLFVDRTTGYIYGHNIESGTTYQISNTTLPGIYDAYIFGDRVLMRYLDEDRKTILSILANIPSVGETDDAKPLININTLPKNISSVAVNQSHTEASYVVPNDNGASVYTVTPKGISTVASSPFAEWLLSYGGNQLYATTKASAYIEGITASLPSFARVLGGKTGLTTLGGTSYLLHSMWSASGLLTFSTKGNETHMFNVQTLAAKCAQINQSFVCGVPKDLPETTEGLPDDWYQGSVSFDDTLQVLDPSTGQSTSFYTFPEKFGAFDVTSLQTNPSGEALSFIRKQDGKLFLLRTNLLGD